MTVPSLDRDAGINAHAPAQYPGRDTNPTPAPADDTQRGPPKFDLNTMFQSDHVEELDDDSDVDENLEGDPQNEGVTDPEPTPTSSPSDVLMQEQLRTQQGLTQALQALLQGQQQQRQDPPREAPKPEQRVWVRPESIPQQMVALLQSEDPAERTQGLALFGDALARMVYAQFQKDVTETYQPQFQGYVNDHYAQQNAAQEFRRTFETKYPQLMSSDDGKMVARLLIEKTVTKLASDGVPQPQIGWGNPKFEQTFNGFLTALNLPGAPAKAKGKTQPGAQPRGPGRSSGARPQAPNGGQKSQQDQMADVLQTARMGRR